MGSGIADFDGAEEIRGGTDGTKIGNVGDALKTSGANSIAQIPDPEAGSLTALNSTVVFDNSTVGYGAIGIQITGTWAGTITPSVSIDGSTYVNISIHNIVSGVFTSSTTANGLYTLNLGGIKYLKLTMSAYTSGTATVTLFATNAKTQAETVSINQSTSAAGVSNSTLVPTIETEHNKIHQGKMFHIGLDNTLANNATWIFLFTPVTNTAHLQFQFFTNGIIDFHIYKNPTGVTTSTSYTGVNRQTGSATTAQGTMQLVTAVTTLGTEIDDLLLGSSGGGNSSTQLTRGQEWDFTTGNTFLFHITSNSSSNNTTLWVDWYEG